MRDVQRLSVRLSPAVVSPETTATTAGVAVPAVEARPSQNSATIATGAEHSGSQTDAAAAVVAAADVEVVGEGSYGSSLASRHAAIAQAAPYPSGPAAPHALCAVPRVATSSEAGGRGGLGVGGDLCAAGSAEPGVEGGLRELAASSVVASVAPAMRAGSAFSPPPRAHDSLRSCSGEPALPDTVATRPS